ncbi:MAG: GTP-binding protein HflX [Actinomycetia bacterium]|nr:GTP-binding protein HflX [Actinomycetes bacterium]
MSKRHEERQRRTLTATETDFDVIQQRALLVGTYANKVELEDAELSMTELALLTETAGALPVASELQHRTTVHPATFIGKGKAEELRQLALAEDIDVVIFDDELSPKQQRNLEDIFKVDVVDRVALILDIFAQHARSQEGMVQVELAQLRYRLPRLRGRGLQLSQQGAGIGTRGPGETQLEVDRRRILRKVRNLEADLVRLGRTRSNQRKARRSSEFHTVALVGYTNSGKSTLLNRITGSDVLVENQLFSTLDPTTRRLVMPGGETVLVSDTVGFVRRLPHQLVEAFRSTLEEAAEVDFLVHVIDASAVDVERPIAAVETVLRSIGAEELPQLLVFNKTDLVDPLDLKGLLVQHRDAVAVSAATGDGVAEFLERLGDELRALDRVVEFMVPYDRGDVVAALHREGEVLVEVHGEQGTRVQARLPEAGVARFQQFIAV